MKADWKIAVNLELVVSVAPIRGGSKILYAGSDEGFELANDPQQILKNEDFDSA